MAPRPSKHLGPETLKYLVVGAGGYVVDVSLFNLFLSGATNLDFFTEPVTAKVFSTVAAVCLTYIANARWTFAQRNGRRIGLLQFTLFIIVNLVGLLFSVACLWISHYILGFQSAIADNISANFVGVGLATVFRFVANRRWVFLKPDPAPEPLPIQV
jgi:putative flippase GtrA